MKKFIYYIGIDVSKLKLDVTVLWESAQDTKTSYHVIANEMKSIAQFIKELSKRRKTEDMVFCFEDTGVYSLLLAYYFSNKGLCYSQVPYIEIKRSKGISRGKSDKTDSSDIAFYAYTHLHKLSLRVIPVVAVQKLKLLFAEREKVLKALAVFERTNENIGFIPAEIYSCVSSINKSVVSKLKNALSQIEEKMLEIIKRDDKIKEQYKLVTSIPEIGRQTAIYLIIATKSFDAFDNWRKLACYAGTAPFPYQSGTSIKGRTKVHPMADKKLKSLLNMCAMVAVRYDKELKIYYERKIKEGKSKMLVLNNVRCKLLARVFAVINRQTPFVDICKFVA